MKIMKIKWHLDTSFGVQSSLSQEVNWFSYFFFFFSSEPTIFPIYPLFRSKERIWKRFWRTRNENLASIVVSCKGEQIFVKAYFKIHYYKTGRRILRSVQKNPRAYPVFIRFEPLNQLATIGKLTRAEKEEEEEEEGGWFSGSTRATNAREW